MSSLCVTFQILPCSSRVEIIASSHEVTVSLDMISVYALDRAQHELRVVNFGSSTTSPRKRHRRFGHSYNANTLLFHPLDERIGWVLSPERHIHRFLWILLAIFQRPQQHSLVDRGTFAGSWRRNWSCGRFSGGCRGGFRLFASRNKRHEDDKSHTYS